MAREASHRRGLLTRWELATGILVVLAVAAYALPIVQRATWRTRRAEAPYLLESLLAAQAQARHASGRGFAVGPVPIATDAVGRDRHAWAAGPSTGSWKPPTQSARCSYQAISLKPELVLQAHCDVDGDGERAIYEARAGYTIRRLTPEDVY